MRLSSCGVCRVPHCAWPMRKAVARGPWPTRKASWRVADERHCMHAPDRQPPDPLVRGTGARVKARVRSTDACARSRLRFFDLGQIESLAPVWHCPLAVRCGGGQMACLVPRRSVLGWYHWYQARGGVTRASPRSSAMYGLCTCSSPCRCTHSVSLPDSRVTLSL